MVVFLLRVLHQIAHHLYSDTRIKETFDPAVHPQNKTAQTTF